MKKKLEDWVNEILGVHPDFTPTQVWNATHRWLSLEAIKKYMEELEDASESEQEGTEEEDIASA